MADLLSKSPERPLALVTADLHVARQTWISRPDILFDSRIALDLLLDLVEKRRPRYVFLLGDILDSLVATPMDLYILRGFLIACRNMDTDVCYLAGNHDKRDKDGLHWLDLYGCVRLTGFVELGGVRIYGFDYLRTPELKETLKLVPKDTDLVLCHQTWKEFVHPRAANQGSLAQIPHGKLVISGDVHIHKEITVHRPAGSTFTALSPGSTCLQDISEEPVKQIYMIEADLSYESVVLPSRPVIKGYAFTVQELADLEAVVALYQVHEDLPKALRKPILRVEYDPAVPNVAERLEHAWGETAHVVLVPRAQVTEELARPTSAELVQVLHDAVVSASSGDEDLIRDFYRLESAQDPAREGETIIKEESIKLTSVENRSQ